MAIFIKTKWTYILDVITSVGIQRNFMSKFFTRPYKSMIFTTVTHICIAVYYTLGTYDIHTRWLIALSFFILFFNKIHRKPSLTHKCQFWKEKPKWKWFWMWSVLGQCFPFRIIYEHVYKQNWVIVVWAFCVFYLWENIFPFIGRMYEIFNGVYWFIYQRNILLYYTWSVVVHISIRAASM